MHEPASTHHRVIDIELISQRTDILTHGRFPRRKLIWNNTDPDLVLLFLSYKLVRLLAGWRTGGAAVVRCGRTSVDT